MVDPYVVFQKFVLDAGGLKKATLIQLKVSSLKRRKKNIFLRNG